MTDDVTTETEDDVFTEPDDTTDEWVDVRMTDPDAGEWDIDVVVAEGQVEFVDLRIEPALLSGFIDCLVDDLGETRAREILAAVARRQGLDLAEDSEA
ncbi:hypothetical protein [Haloarcula salinisoli]|uniref:Uncharacterized protein n=1 Tax=Haloarcula salinisoli TaxID=2487746 RepID=A0A8J8C8B9_9EURY|nr:hypothetical protein [Halomicroarcula salinisoli]MBX0286939.1 hypothetical protein [Halomicroarcula salinisoli]MBX0304241.1 hypothetical protein [Halomicroarcula salinisoli]